MSKEKFKIRDGRVGDIEECINIHRDTLRGGFFSELDTIALKKLYLLTLTDKDSFLIVEECKNKIVGVGMGYKNWNKLIGIWCSNHLFYIFLPFIKIMLTKPYLLFPIINVFSNNKIPKAKLSFLFVVKKYRRKGSGKALIEKINSKFCSMGISEYNVEISILNKKVKKFYQKMGFVYYDKPALYKTNKKFFIMFLNKRY